MIARVCKSFTFSAAHRLTKVPPIHKCSQLHGHTYRVDLVFQGHTDGDTHHRDETDMVIDFGRVAVLWDPIHRLLDHHLLNDIEGLSNPTSEVLALFIGRMLLKIDAELPLVAVRVHEGESSWAEVEFGPVTRPEWALER
jgi:6-pyruvoyltetrahydropterin/6-carboxytetrahydropterin synthase